MLHVPLAILIQFVFIILGIDPWIGAAAASGYFIGREYAQAEYRLIEHYYGAKRANMPTLAPMRDSRAWNTKSILDWLLPLIATIAIAVVFDYWTELKSRFISGEFLSFLVV
jgi:hypothetical protein